MNAHLVILPTIILAGMYFGTEPVQVILRLAYHIAF